MPSPGEDVQSWSTTASDNGTADSLINWAEFQPRASVNNSARGMMAAHAKARNLQNGSITTAGTANAQTFFSGMTYTTIPTGLRVTVKIGSGLTNDGPATINMDGIGAVPVKNNRGVSVGAGALLAGAYVDLLYDGANWIVMNDIVKVGTAGAVGSTVGTLLSRFNASSSASVVFTGLDTTYTYYQVVCANIRPANSNVQLRMQWSKDGGASWIVTNYNMNSLLYKSTTGSGPQSTTIDAVMPNIPITPQINLTSTSPFSNAIVELFNFGMATTPALCMGRSTHLDWNVLSLPMNGLIHYYYTGSNTGGISNVNAIKLFMDSGNIASGTFLLYGYP